MRILRSCRALAFVAAAIPLSVGAQATGVLAKWIALDAPPGEERAAGNLIRQGDAAWTQDAQGNLVKRVGSGRPRRVIACGLDHTGYVVSQITDDGYIRLHRAGSIPIHSLYDQALQAQQVEIRTARGIVPGVVGVPNGHFARQHRGDTTVVGVDQLWVDVGARSKAEAASLGIALIDPVRRDVPPWEYADHVAGTDASGRAGCAAVVAVANAGAPASGENVYIVSAQRSFGWVGLSGALTRVGPIEEFALVSPASLGAMGTDPVMRRRSVAPAALAAAAGRDSLTSFAVRARWSGTLVETIRGTDADALRAALAEFAGVDVARARWVAPADDRTTKRLAPPNDSLSRLAETLRHFADLPGVPGHEFRVREAIRAALPAWARNRAIVDSAGNLFLSVGPARDTVVAVAHTDEVSFVVSGILGDGTVALDTRGGVIPSAWEGQPALLHFDTDVPSLPGVFIPRDSAVVRAPRSVTAWFGLDSTALVARGVRIGMGVTAYKRAERLASVRFTGRAMDDRVGSTALLQALIGLDTTRLDHTIVFAWSVYEEGGLNGARAIARRFGPTVKRVYAIDTFVSSDTPLELPTFAYAPLGKGPVLRALDDGLIVSRVERERVIGLAQQAGIPLQVGTTHGGTDAGPFTQTGALGAGISWPGRYSHSPAEVLDLRDLSSLSRLIRVLLSAPTR